MVWPTRRNQVEVDSKKISHSWLLFTERECRKTRTYELSHVRAYPVYADSCSSAASGAKQDAPGAAARWNWWRTLRSNWKWSLRFRWTRSHRLIIATNPTRCQDRPWQSRSSTIYCFASMNAKKTRDRRRSRPRKHTPSPRHSHHFSSVSDYLNSAPEMNPPSSKLISHTQKSSNYQITHRSHVK